ncbi:MAG: radical SAM protein [Candidatus Diapherotrites archaeon]|nr:radical SAM protein [Candidatus Diapherotrites archaeon]
MARQALMTKVLKNALFPPWHPVHVILHVGSPCNARCSHCFNWQNLNKTDDLTLEEMKKLSDNFGELVFLDLSGGEPFLRKDLDEIVRYFDEHNHPLFVDIPTNAFLPGKVLPMTEKIVSQTEMGISINISLDGLKETHEKSRKVPGGFDKLVETFHGLKELKKKYKNLAVNFNTAISNANIKELPEAIEWVKSLEPDFHQLFFVRPGTWDAHVERPSLEELAVTAELVKKTWRHYKYYADFDPLQQRFANLAHDFIMDTNLKCLEEERQIIPCLGGQAHCVVYPNGTVGSCEMLPPIGNLRDYGFDFKKLWFDHQAKTQRESIQRGDCHCTHGCVLQDSMVFNPLVYPSLAAYILNPFYREKKYIPKAPALNAPRHGSLSILGQAEWQGPKA